MQERWARRFFTIWSAQALSVLGSGLVQFALIWWLTATTGSATVLAMASLIGLLPGIVLGPFSGALVDRWDRRRTMILSDGTIALATAILGLVYALGYLEPWHVYVLLFVRSVAGGFHWPSMAASTSLMVPEEQLGRVAGMNQTLNGVANIAMPPLGALLMSLLPLHGIVAIDVATAAIAILPLFFIAIPQPERADTRPPSARLILQDMGQALRYFVGWRPLLTIMVVSMLVNILLTPAFSLIPILVTRHLEGQAFQLAWLDTAAGVGIVLGGLTLSAWGGFKRRTVTMLLGLIGIGLGCLIVGWTPARAIPMAIVGTLVLGFFLPLCDGPFMAILQSTVEPGMQGRVFSLVGAASKLATPLSLAVAGPLSDRFGVPVWFTAAGFVCVALGLAVMAMPSVLNMEIQRSGAAGVPLGAVEVGSGQLPLGE